MLRRRQRWSQSEEVNCGPRSDVIMDGTPKREIQVWMRAEAQSAAVGFRPTRSTVDDSEEMSVTRGRGKGAHKINMEMRKTLRRNEMC